MSLTLGWDSFRHHFGMDSVAVLRQDMGPPDAWKRGGRGQADHEPPAPRPPVQLSSGTTDRAPRALTAALPLGSGREGLCSPITGSPCLPQMQEKAKEIYMTFLSSKASSQVNVEGQSRLSETILEEPHPLMFQKLQDQVT